MVIMNIITDNTTYLQLDFYSQAGIVVYTAIVPKINITSVSTYYNKYIEDDLGIVILRTNCRIFKNNWLDLIPSKWALSTDPLTPIVDAITLRGIIIDSLDSSITYIVDEFGNVIVGDDNIIVEV